MPNDDSSPSDPYHRFLFPHESDLGLLIRACMERAGEVQRLGRPITQTELSKLMHPEGLDSLQPQISAYLTTNPARRQIPQDETLRVMAEAFGRVGVPISFDELKRARDASQIGEEILASPRDERLRRIEADVRTFPADVQDAFYDEVYRLWENLKKVFRSGRESL